MTSLYHPLAEFFNCFQKFQLCEHVKNCSASPLFRAVANALGHESKRVDAETSGDAFSSEMLRVTRIRLGSHIFGMFFFNNHPPKCKYTCIVFQHAVAAVVPFIAAHTAHLNPRCSEPGAKPSNTVICRTTVTRATFNLPPPAPV